MTAIDPIAPVLMTLAGIAYGHPSAIPGYLAEDALTGAWQVAWIADAVDVPVNFAFIARDTSTGAYAIAIRGTYPNPFSPAYWDDADQDNPLGPMQPWPGSAEAKVSGGTFTGFNNLLQLSGDGRSFMDAVQAIPPDAPVYVTGHSLGGTLAPVIALWMTGLPQPLAPDVYCFAGMTPGNAAFADLFAAGTRLGGKVRRYNNTLDSVGYGWDRVLQTRKFFEPAPRGGLLVEAALLDMAFKLAPYGYTSIGEEVKLPGTVKAIAIPCEIIAYVLETLHQHMPDTYLALLGAPALPFSIGFGAVVAPRARSLPPTGSADRMPVFYL